MAGDDLSAIAGPGIQTQAELIAEAEGAIIEMAGLLCAAICALYDLQDDNDCAVTVTRDGQRLVCVALAPRGQADCDHTLQ